MHQLKEVDMLFAKMDLLMKKLEDQANEKQDIMHIHDSHMTCEECGNTRHVGNNYPETQEDVNFINNNNYRPQQGHEWGQQQRPNYQGNNYNNQSSLKDLVYGQAKIMEGLFRKLASTDKVLENINNRIDSFSSAIKSSIALIKC